MQFPIVQQYKTDIEGNNPENQIRDEPRSVEPGLWTRVIVPLHAPFFVKSLVMKKPNGQPLIKDVDYRIHRLMTRLTEHCAEPVACMIELIPEDLTDVMMDYKVVGEFSLIDNSMLQLITTAVDDDRPVWWENLENKPVVFPPTLHSHSLIRDIIAWQDTIDCMDMYLAMKAANGREAVQVRVDHFYNLLSNYINVYGQMLSEYLANHLDAYNAHGLTAAQIGKENVDNFATATTGNVMQGRKDMHLTPLALETIVETYGFNSEEFLGAALLPLSRFGNTNFIPPSIDGSFEGLGSKAETNAICQEDDGSLVLVGNRLDGRVNGLYCSVIKDYDTPAPKQTFSAFKWTHPKFIQDGANVDVVVSGSNGEAMLVGDSFNQQYYIGITNGTMNPSKHVYCRLDMDPLLQAVYGDWATRRMSDDIHLVSIAVVGEWIYIFFAHWNGSVDDPEGSWWARSYTYRYFFRVRISDIRLLNPLTPQRVNMTFQDLDGVQWNNAPVWRWGTRVVNDHALRRTQKLLFPLLPYDDQGARVSWTQLSISTPAPSGKTALKFLSYYYSGMLASGNYCYADLDVAYEIDPNTNVMTKISQIPLPTINFNDPTTFAGRTGNWSALCTSDAKTSIAVLDDLTVVSTHSFKYNGFPWFTTLMKAAGPINKYDLLTKTWNLLPMSSYTSAAEGVVPPTVNNVSVRPPLQFPGAEVFMATKADNSNFLGLFIKRISGKYVYRANIQNLLVPNIVSRALTNNIRKVNCPPGIGGATVSVPSSLLDTYGIEISQSAMCLGAQRRYFDRNAQGNAWSAPVGLDDVLLIGACNFRDDADGTTTIVPTRELLWPSNIVAALKAQIERPDLLSYSGKVFVTVFDPNGGLTAKFGWLPTLVMVTYVDPVNFTRRVTTMSVSPTYSEGGLRATVTGFTVLDKAHGSFPGSASQQSQGYWDAWITGTDTPGTVDGLYIQGSQCCLVYLDADGSLDIYLDPAIQSGAYSNVVGMATRVKYANRGTGRWTTCEFPSTQVNVPTYAVTPDNGISICWNYEHSTGGAGVIQKGSVNNPLLASVYPEIGWVIFFQAPTDAVFQGKAYTFPAGLVDLRDIDASPGNKTFYVYATLVNNKPTYQVTLQKRLETLTQLWAATVKTNGTQIVTVERLNVFALNGHRITEVKRGNSIPGASGLVNEEGQIPWFYPSEILP